MAVSRDSSRSCGAGTLTPAGSADDSSPKTPATAASRSTWTLVREPGQQQGRRAGRGQQHVLTEHAQSLDPAADDLGRLLAGTGTGRGRCGAQLDEVGLEQRHVLETGHRGVGDGVLQRGQLLLDGGDQCRHGTTGGVASRLGGGRREGRRGDPGLRCGKRSAGGRVGRGRRAQRGLCRAQRQGSGVPGGGEGTQLTVEQPSDQRAQRLLRRGQRGRRGRDVGGGLGQRCGRSGRRRGRARQRLPGDGLVDQRAVQHALRLGHVLRRRRDLGGGRGPRPGQGRPRRRGGRVGQPQRVEHPGEDLGRQRCDVQPPGAQQRADAGQGQAAHGEHLAGVRAVRTGGAGQLHLAVQPERRAEQRDRPEVQHARLGAAVLVDREAHGRRDDAQQVVDAGVQRRRVDGGQRFRWGRRPCRTRPVHEQRRQRERRVAAVLGPQRELQRLDVDAADAHAEQRQRGARTGRRGHGVDVSDRRTGDERDGQGGGEQRADLHSETSGAQDGTSCTPGVGARAGRSR